MNNRQIKQVKMFIRIRLFFSNNTTLLQAFAPLWLLITDFLLSLKSLEGEINTQDLDNTGITSSKDGKRALMISLIVPLSRKARVWAKASGDKALATQFDIHKSSFGISELEDLALATNIIALLNLNATALVAYNITALQLTAAGTAVTSFKDAITTPDQSASESETATTNIANDITNIMDQLVDIDDLLIPEYEITNATVVANYKTNRVIGEAAVQHTTATVHIYEDDAHVSPVVGATFSIVELNRSGVSNGEGMAEIVQFKEGNYTMKIVATGKVDVIMPLSIKSGKHVETNIVMVPNKISGTLMVGDKPAVNSKVLIQGTIIQVVPDDFGNFVLPNIPDGNGVIEATNVSGQSVTQPFVMVNGRELVINLKFD